MTPNLAGMRVGRLTVIVMGGKRGNRREWLCDCDCGARVSRVTSDLTRKNAGDASCGCAHRERVSRPEHLAKMQAASTTHGKRNTRTYTSWADMIQRCTNPKREKYPEYGGRGITVCARWLHSFENFLADMGERPAGTTIDRIDNDGNYEPGNCRWATPTQQRANQRRRAS